MKYAVLHKFKVGLNKVTIANIDKKATNYI